MKKIVVFMLTATMLFMMTACRAETVPGKPGKNGGEGQELLGTLEQGAPDEVITCPVQYIRTDGWQEQVRYPQIAILESAASLEAYIEDNHLRYDLGCREAASADSTIGFVMAVEGYDEAWFEENVLVLVILEEGSGSNRHEVKGVTAKGEILIERIVPEVGTCDMAVWHIMLELPKDCPALEHTLQVTWVNEEKNLPEVTPVSYTSRYAAVEVALPRGWEWEEIPDTGGENPYGLRFWPEGDKNAAVELCCHSQIMGLCGTGLNTYELLLDNGNTASVHAYDGDPWFLVSFDKSPGYYYATRSGGTNTDYDDEILEILGSAVLGWGVMEYDKAVAIAEEACDIPHTYANAYFDIDTGFWTVCLGSRGQAGGGAEVVINDIGGIESIAYGE